MFNFYRYTFYFLDLVLLDKNSNPENYKLYKKLSKNKKYYTNTIGINCSCLKVAKDIAKDYAKENYFKVIRFKTNFNYY